MDSGSTRVKVHVVSCDAKVIGSLVGGCRVTIRDARSGELLAEGEQQGGSGDTALIMEQPRERGATVFAGPGVACFETDLPIAEPTAIRIEATGPLACPEAAQSASLTTWLNPGAHLEGDGFVLQLHGFILDILEPEAVETIHSNREVGLRVGVRLL